MYTSFEKQRNRPNKSDRVTELTGIGDFSGATGSLGVVQRETIALPDLKPVDTHSIAKWAVFPCYIFSGPYLYFPAWRRAKKS